jgi:signal transduction histidine kinase
LQLEIFLYGFWDHRKVSIMKLSVRLKSFMAVTPGVMFGTALSLGVAVLSYLVTVRTIDRDNEERFGNMARNAQYTIDARIRSYTNVLRSAASLFQADLDVSRDNFHRYVMGLDLAQHYPAIETVNYVRWVTDQERDAFEARVRHEDALAHDGRPLFRITPEGRRPTYSIVMYVEPDRKWAHTVGIDLNTQPPVYKALMHSRDTGILATSGAPIRAMKDKKRTGLGMRLPIYRSNAPLNNVEQRRNAYIGSIGIAFSVERLMQGVLNELPLKTVRLSLFNYVDAAGPPGSRNLQLIYDSIATDADPAPAPGFDDPARFHVVLPVDFNGRQWKAHFSTPKEAVYRSSDRSFPLLAMLAGFTTTMLLYGLFYMLTSSRKRAIELAQEMTRELRESQAQLLLSHQKLRELAAHTENIKESERKRIAREIHDDLGQNLLALRIDAQLLFSRTGGHHPHLHARAESTLGQIDATIKSVRQIINDLRPNVLDLGVNAAVDWQITEFQRRTGIECELVEYHQDIIVSDNCATALFRILQESLTNVRRHSSATSVRVDLRVERGMVYMTIHDNGVGLKSRPHKPGTFGLLGIEERINILGGTFSIRSTPGAGTTIAIAIPAQQEYSHSGDAPAQQHSQHGENELV